MTTVVLSGLTWVVPADFTSKNTITAVGGASGETKVLTGANLIPGATLKILLQPGGKTIVYGNTDMPILTAFPGVGAAAGSITVNYTPQTVPVRPRYRPPTGVVRAEFPFLAAVTAADPDWGYRKHRELEYHWEGRGFYADPYVRGAYNNNPN